jgi:hypothetical protein
LKRILRVCQCQLPMRVISFSEARFSMAAPREMA